MAQEGPQRSIGQHVRAVQPQGAQAGERGGADEARRGVREAATAVAEGEAHEG